MNSSTLFTLVALGCFCPIIAKGQTSVAHESPSRAKQRTALRAAATTLCTELRRESIQGLPTDEQLQRLSTLLTPELQRLFKTARAIQEEQIRRHPDEKPYWVEGDLFSSLTEGVTAWELGEDTLTAPGAATVEVKQTYNEPQQKPFAWTDTLVFRQCDQRWLLDNVHMGGDWLSDAAPSLRTTLPGGTRETRDHTSLNERWQIKFTHQGEHVCGVSIQPTDKSSAPQVLFGNSDGDVCLMPTWVVWSPHDDMFALRLGDGHRYTRTLIFRLVGKSWESVPMPEFYPEEKKTMLSNGFRERYNLIDADHWQDETTLVVRYFGSFESNDDSDGFSQLISVRVDAKGAARVIAANDTPSDH